MDIESFSEAPILQRVSILMNLLFHVMLLSLSISVIIAGVNQVVSREQAIAEVNNRIQDIRTDIAAGGQESLIVSEKRKELGRFIQLRLNLKEEQLAGQRRIDNMTDVFNDIGVGVARDVTPSNKRIIGHFREETLNVMNITFPFSAIFVFIPWVQGLPSDTILSIGMLAGGYIGAAIASIRRYKLIPTRDAVLGMVTGFFVFLTIRGGKHLFLIQGPGEMISLNPYGTILAAIVAGLFTEKAYQVLSILVDRAAAKVASEDVGTKGPSEEAPAKPSGLRDSG